MLRCAFFFTSGNSRLCQHLRTEKVRICLQISQLLDCVHPEHARFALQTLSVFNSVRPGNCRICAQEIAGFSLKTLSVRFSCSIPCTQKTAGFSLQTLSVGSIVALATSQQNARFSLRRENCRMLLTNLLSGLILRSLKTTLQPYKRPTYGLPAWQPPVAFRPRRDSRSDNN